MDVVFLGTSAGVPTRKRNVTAAAIKKQSGKAWYLVDCGEGTQHRVMQTPLSLHRLDAVLITHVHGDHCYGLPGLLASASMSGRRHALTIIAPAAIRDYLDAIQATTGLHLTFPLEFVAVEAVNARLSLPDFSVEPVKLSHGVASYGFVFHERGVESQLDTERLDALGVPRGPAWGRLHRGEDVTLDDGTQVRSDEVLLPSRPARKVVIGGDNDAPSRLEAACLGASLLVHEATYTEDVVERLGSDNQHSTAAAVATFAQAMALPNLILTHFSPRYHDKRGVVPNIGDVEREARNHYRNTLYLARDLETYRLSRDGQVSRLERP
ncbi:MBL fold metallo-hydrolase [Modicisalibacter xianhensis]|uniref:Ribonuclease Z n=1 Tax=Modicisalibacter xianhensis TaxID=442341 RepID=A0A1I2YRC1_9GAMM|nr:MBL fold metallo-hydrolase [Halomonas xianhensis]SFH27829.1 RNAse Z [Halomonas xianhensis]